MQDICPGYKCCNSCSEVVVGYIKWNVKFLSMNSGEHHKMSYISKLKLDKRADKFLKKLRSMWENYPVPSPQRKTQKTE